MRAILSGSATARREFWNAERMWGERWSLPEPD
jgi:hypothetical protein